MGIIILIAIEVIEIVIRLNVITRPTDIIILIIVRNNNYQLNQNRQQYKNNKSDYDYMYNSYAIGDIMIAPTMTNAFIKTNNFFMPQTQIYTDRIFNEYYDFQYYDDDDNYHTKS